MMLEIVNDIMMTQEMKYALYNDVSEVIPDNDYPGMNMNSQQDDKIST
jgi:hypothetical protein